MASYYPLADWTTLSIVGDDRTKWLQNLCTNDVQRLPAGTGCEAFITDVKGKIVGHVYLLVETERILVVTVPGQAERLSSHCNRYVIREDVCLTDVSDQYAWCVVHGNDRDAALQAASGADAALPSESWHHVASQQAEGSCLVVNSNATIAETHWVATTPAAQGAMLETFEAHQAQRLSDDQFLALRVEARWPWWGVDFDADNLPQEVGRNEAAISFTKGCYLGQETVARIDALGHVNRQLSQVRFEGADVPEPGIELLHDGKAVGKATSTVWSTESNCPLALAMLRRSQAAPGTVLDSRAGRATVQ